MQRVVWTGPGFRVVLDRGSRHIPQHQPLHRAVVQVQLLQLGCRRGQGYLFGRPIAAAGVPNLIDGDKEASQATQ